MLAKTSVIFLLFFISKFIFQPIFKSVSAPTKNNLLAEKTNQFLNRTESITQHKPAWNTMRAPVPYQNHSPPCIFVIPASIAKDNPAPVKIKPPAD